MRLEGFELAWLLVHEMTPEQRRRKEAEENRDRKSWAQLVHESDIALKFEQIKERQDKQETRKGHKGMKIVGHNQRVMW